MRVTPHILKSIMIGLVRPNRTKPFYDYVLFVSVPLRHRQSSALMGQAPRLDAGMRLKAAMPEKPLASRWGWLAFPTKAGNRAFAQVVPFLYIVLYTKGTWTPYSTRPHTPRGNGFDHSISEWSSRKTWPRGRLATNQTCSLFSPGRGEGITRSSRPPAPSAPSRCLDRR